MSHARTFVVGDIHGCATELDRLLDALAPAAADTVVFLGDYIDRGPASREVIDRVLRLRHEGPTCVFLRGNHEDMFLSYLGERGAYGDAFLYNGGSATLQSYGVNHDLPQEMRRALPPEHFEFLQSLRLQYTHGPFLCVHAGLAPGRPLANQREEDLLWIREEFIREPHPHGLTVLFGHTPHREVLIDLPYKIGLDTGLVYGNKLSCFELEGKQLFQIGRGGHKIVTRNLRERFLE